MCKERVKKVELFCALVSGMIKNLIPVAYADGEGGDPPPTDPPASGGNTDPAPTGGNTPPAPAPTFNYEDLIKKARQEEKDKLYKEMKKLRDDLKKMTDSNNANLLRVGELEAENATLKNGGETEAEKALKAKIAELETEIENLKKNAPDEVAIRASIEAEYEVKTYRIEQLAKDENKNAILPMFLDGVTGNTKEEIDASIQSAIEKTNQAREQFGIDPNATPAPTNTQIQPPPAVNPPDPSQQFKNQADIDVMNSLDLRNPADRKKYEELREKLGLKSTY